MKFITVVITMLFAASVSAAETKKADAPTIGGETKSVSAAETKKVDAPKAGGETKEVCKDVVGKDGKATKNKDGSTKQTCKKIKVHKKVEGTKVPEKK